MQAFIKIYVWNYEENKYDVVKLPGFDEFGRTIKYDVVRCGDKNDSLKYCDELFANCSKIEIVPDEEIEKANRVIDKSKCIIEGTLKPFVYIEFGLLYLEIKSYAAFGVIKTNEFYQLKYKLPKKFDKIRIVDGEYQFLNIIEIQLPYLKKEIQLCVDHFKIDQTLDEVYKENPTYDKDELKEEFGNFIIEQFEKFVEYKLNPKVEEMKMMFGYNNNHDHRFIYEIVKRILPKLNKRLDVYNKMCNKHSSFVFNEASRKVELVE